MLLLVISGLSFARTMQRTYETAWQLPPRGLRGSMGGVAALALLLTQILLLSLVAGFLRSVPAGSVLEFVVRACAASGVWLALQYLLLGGRVPWRRLVPGAIVAGTRPAGRRRAVDVVDPDRRREQRHPLRRDRRQLRHAVLAGPHLDRARGRRPP